MKQPLAILFSVAQQRYAVPCRKIAEVLPWVVLRSPARAPVWLAGAFIHRGELIPVIDLCRLLGAYACPELLSSRIMVASCRLPDGAASLVGLLAERVTEACRLGTTEVRDGATHAAPYLGGLRLEGDELLQLFDVDQLLSGPASEPAEYFQAARRSGLGAHEAHRTLTES